MSPAKSADTPLLREAGCMSARELLLRWERYWIRSAHLACSTQFTISIKWPSTTTTEVTRSLLVHSKRDVGITWHDRRLPLTNLIFAPQHRADRETKGFGRRRESGRPGMDT